MLSPTKHFIVVFVAAALACLAAPAFAQTLSYTYSYDASGNLMRVVENDTTFLSATLDGNENVVTVGTNAASEGEGEGEGMSEGEGTAEGEGASEGEGEGEGEGLPEGEGSEPTLEEIAAGLADGFASADTNLDGMLSYSEAAAVYPSLTQAQFDALDTDGDGALTEAELAPDMPAGCSCPGNKGLKGFGETFGDSLLWMFGLALMVYFRFSGRDY
jgi:hypothetical protein